MIRASIKSLLGRKVRLLLSTFAIVLGVAFVAGSLIFSDMLNRSFTAIFASSVGDVVVQPVNSQTASGAFSALTVPAGLVDELAQVEGVARADGNVGAFGVYVVGSNSKVVGGLGPPAIGGNWNDAPAAGGDGLEIVAGEAPEGLEEVMFDERTAERAGYEIGDRVVLLTPRGASRLTPTLVGLVGYPDGGSLNGATLALFDTPTSQELFLNGQDSFTDVWVTADEGVSQEELAASVRKILPAGFEARTGDTAAEESASDLLEAVSFITTFLLVFALISLVVGAFLIINTFSILVAQRSRELALLRALGASRRQVMGSVQIEAVVLGLLGSTIGLGLGVLLAMLLRVLFGQFGLDLSGQPIVFAPRTVVASYVVGVLVTLAAALLPAWRTTRIAPVQALRDDIALPETSIRRRLLVGVVMVGVGLVALGLGLFVQDVPRPLTLVGIGILLVLLGVAATSPVISRPFLSLAQATYTKAFGPVGRLAGQNSLRNPRRTTATASALMIGLTLACTMAIIGNSAKASVDKSVADNFVGDFIVSNVFGGEFNASIADEMARVEGVEKVVRQRFQFLEVDGDDEAVSATEPEAATDLRLDVIDGTGALDDGQVLLQQSHAEDHNLRVGDTLEVKVPTGDTEWEVVGIYEDNPVIFSGVLTTVGTFEASGFEPADNFLLIYAEEGADRVTMQEALDEKVADLPIVTVKDQAAFAAEQREPIDQFVLMIFALLGLALIIAVLGIVNTLALSIIERTREIGLLRAIGLSRRQLRRMITLESVVISLLGAILGVVLGLGFGVALMYALRDEGLEVISIPYDQLGIFLLVSLVIGVLAALLPARRASRLDVLRAIATE